MDWYCECEGAVVPTKERGYDPRGGRVHLANPAHTLRCETDTELSHPEYTRTARNRWTQRHNEELVG